jgi:hypothetical protein
MDADSLKAECRLLSPDFDGGLARFDELRARGDAAMTAEHASSAVDLIFTADERWSAPLATEARDPEES